MSGLLAYDFVRHALGAALLAAAVCGVVGTIVVIKRMVFVGGGISHAAFGGLGICAFLGVDPRIGAALAAVVAALALGTVGRRQLESHDSAVGLLWAVGMAVGMIFLARSPGYAPDLGSYLFGNILAVSSLDLWLTAAFLLLAVSALWWRWREVVAVAFDEELAEIQGLPVRAVRTGLMAGVALAVVLLIQLVGIVLAIALLTIPPLVALRFARSLTVAMVLATGVAALMNLGGLVFAYAWELPSGPAIVLWGALLLGVAKVVEQLRAGALKRRPS